MKTLILSLSLVAAFAGCQIADADLEVSSLVDFSITPSSTDLDQLSVEVTGSATLAYTSEDDAATLEIYVGGARAYVESFDASASRELDFAADLPLEEGENEIVAHLEYHGEVLTRSVVVDVAEGVQGFTLTAAQAEVDRFEVGLTVDTALGYYSGDAATLEVAVEGQSVYLETIAATDSLAAQLTPTVPLSRVGPNEIVATLRYRGNEWTQRTTVTVAPAAPELTFPTWTTDHEQIGSVTVDLDPAWTIDEVAYSVDDGPFTTAALDSGTSYLIALSDLDIGDNQLVVRVDSSNAGHSQSHFFADTISAIEPVFDCSSPASMEPNTTLIANNNYEVRTLRGYFGDPAGGHTVTFVITFVDDNGNTYVNPAATLVYGRTSIDAEFNVNRWRCDGTCTTDYDLEVLVDGNLLCSEANFGIIRDF